ncbi:MAG: hypothetical protein LUQ46_00340, partial [Candidatus Methanomethyliaceae archaeon]|nr:hypothetical protein [Candidatus Methanomethyliaceae archaeon]
YMIKKKQDIFRVAEVGIINKKDMAGYMEIDINELVRDAHNANPKMKVVVTSAKKDEGINELVKALEL